MSGFRFMDNRLEGFLTVELVLDDGGRVTYVDQTGAPARFRYAEFGRAWPPTEESLESLAARLDQLERLGEGRT
jgi:hypothetical protein